jgi:hypothetical protein
VVIDRRGVVVNICLALSTSGYHLTLGIWHEDEGLCIIALTNEIFFFLANFESALLILPFPFLVR